MPEYKSPGVYVEEVERGPKPIEGVSTSTAGFLGQTERGRTAPQLVTSYADYQRMYGGVVEDSNLAYAVEGFFKNGGSRCYIGRVTAATNTADATFRGDDDLGRETELTASTAVVDFGPVAPGAGAQTETITLENVNDTADVQIVHGDIEITDDDEDDFSFSTATGGDVTLTPGDTEEVTIEFDPDNEDAKQASLDIPYQVADNGGWLPEEDTDSPLSIDLLGGTDLLTVEAVGPGEWGTNVAVIIEDATLYEAGTNELFKLTVRYWSDPDDRAVAEAHDADPEEDPVPDPDAEEIYDNLSPDPASSDYYETKVNGASNLVDLERGAPGRPASTDGAEWLSGSFTGADVQLTHFQGNDTDPPEDRTGLAGFAQVDGISIVCVPDENEYTGLTDEIVTHCENQGDRFAVLQAPQDADRPGNLEPPVDSSYAAFYYPWIEVLDPETSNETLVPPGGHVVGIYAKTDDERGVHKAPANEVVRGVQSLQVPISKGDQEVLNPRGVNCIRSFRGRGIRVWGARTTSSDPLWKYVNVRRLFLYLEESIDEGTQWAVFEPNDENLWSRVRQSVSNFLRGAWDDGALMGTTPEEAFYVKCDRSTMTQDDIDNGRLICEIGVAPVKPAEFVVFRISQWTGGGE